MRKNVVMVNLEVEMETNTKGLDAFFQRVFVTKAPVQLPESVREWIAKYSPWISLVMLILLAPVVLGAIGLGTIFGSLAWYGGVTTGMWYWAGFLGSVIEIILLVIALPGLFKRKMSAWKLLYYSALISIIVGVLTNLGYMTLGSLIWGLVMGAVELYFLYQIKAKYA